MRNKIKQAMSTNAKIGVYCGRLSRVIKARSGGHRTGEPPQSSETAAQRIKRIALLNRAAKGKVDHSNVISVLQRDGFLDGADNSAVCACPVLIQHAEINQINAGCNSLEGASAIGTCRTLPAAADDSGYMRSMTIEII